MNPKYNIFTNVGVDMLFLLLACLPEAIDRDQVEVFDNPYHDWDQDGFSESNGDCNDNDPNIVEPKEFYMDADGDGFVDRYSLESICAVQPDGNWVLFGQQLGYDCDDANDTVNPDAFDSCNGVDDDCNGTIDDGKDETTPWWYRDADGDGFGQPILYAEDGTIANPEYAYQGCQAIDGYVGDNTDCDDTDELNFPTNPYWSDSLFY